MWCLAEDLGQRNFLIFLFRNYKPISVWPKYIVHGITEKQKSLRQCPSHCAISKFNLNILFSLLLKVQANINYVFKHLDEEGPGCYLDYLCHLVNYGHIWAALYILKFPTLRINQTADFYQQLSLVSLQRNK